MSNQEEILKLSLTHKELCTLYHIMDLFDVKDLNEFFGGLGEGLDGEGAQRGCAVVDKVVARWRDRNAEVRRRQLEIG